MLPPHCSEGMHTYLLSAACYEHRELLARPDRMSEFAQALLGVEDDLGSTVHAWVILPNHYHIVAETDLHVYRRWVGRLHNGKSTQWNREDGTAGRRVWFRFTDRWIRGAGHYYATINYVHANAVKHGYAMQADEWPWSSVHEYIHQVGLEALEEWSRKYPSLDYGRGWDD